MKSNFGVAVGFIKEGYFVGCSIEFLKEQF